MLNIVVGAGLTGATIARALSDRGQDVIVLEASDRIGGKCQDTQEDGHYVQLHGPHVFHTHRKDIWDFVNRFGSFTPTVFTSMTDTDLGLLPIPVNLHTMSIIYNYQTEAADLLRPEDTAAIEYVLRSSPGPADTFEDVARKRVGDLIFELAFKHYTEAWWGVPCNRIPGRIAQRIPVRRNYDCRYHADEDIYVGVPAWGFSDLISTMLQGIPVHFGVTATISSVRKDFPGTRVFCTADAATFLELSYSMPYRGFKVDSYLVDKNPGYQQIMVSRPGKARAGTRWYCSSNLFANRLGDEGPTVVSHMMPRPDSVPGAAAEAAYPAPWEAGDRLVHLNAAKAKAESEDVFFAGRLGNYKYLDMDDAITDGFDAIERAT